jgi:hypothetical protein
VAGSVGSAVGSAVALGAGVTTAVGSAVALGVGVELLPHAATSIMTTTARADVVRSLLAMSSSSWELP